MKKLVVLILFMLMASLATAGVAPYVLMSQSVDIPLNTVVTVTLKMGDSVQGGFTLAVLEVTGGSVGTVTGAGVWSSGGSPTTTTPVGTGFTVDLNGAADLTNSYWVADATIYSFTFTADVLGNFEVDAISGGWGIVPWAGDQTSGGVDAILPFQAYNVVPEPMTMALLGLGGLFLRRRK